MAAPVNSGVADVATSAKPMGKPEQVARVGADVATSAPNSLPENKTTSTVGTMTEIVTYTNPRKLKRMPREVTKVEKERYHLKIGM